MNKVLWIKRNNSFKLTLARLSAGSTDKDFDEALLNGPGDERYRLMLEMLWDIRGRNKWPILYQWDEIPTPKKIKQTTEWLLECFTPEELEDETWFIPILQNSLKFDKEFEIIDEIETLKNLSERGAIDNKLEPDIDSFAFFPKKTWKKILAQPICTYWVFGYDISSTTFLLTVRFYWLNRIFYPKLKKFWKKNKYDQYLNETLTVENNTQKLSGFHIFLSNATHYVISETIDNLVSEYKIINQIKKKYFEAPKPTKYTANCFLSRSWIAYLQVPTTLVLILSTCSLTINLNLKPEAIGLNDERLTTCRHTTKLHFISQRKERLILGYSKYPFSEKLYVWPIFIRTNNIYRMESVNTLYDYIYALLPEAAKNFESDFWPPQTKYRFPFDWQKRISALFVCARAFIYIISKPVRLKPEKLFRMPPPDNFNRRNPFLKHPVHTNVLVAANEDVTVTFNTLVRERPESTETPFDYSAPKIFTSFLKPKRKSKRFLKIAPNNFTKKTVKLLERRKIIFPIQHPFLKICNGKFDSVFTSKFTNSQLAFDFFSDGFCQYDTANINDSKIIQIRIFNNCLQKLYIHWYTHFDFPTCVGFLSQTKKTALSQNSSQTKWKLSPEGRQALRFLIDQKNFSKKSWLRYVLFSFFEPDVNTKEFHKIILYFKKLLNLPQPPSDIKSSDKSWGNFLAKYWYIKYALISIFTSQFNNESFVQDEESIEESNIVSRLFSREIITMDDKNLWLEVETPLGSQLFLLIQYFGTKINFKFDNLEDFDFLSFLEDFISAYINDFVILSSLPFFKQIHPLIETATNTQFDFNIESELSYFFFLKKNLLPYIFNQILIESVTFFKLEQSAKVQNKSEAKNNLEVLRSIVENPFKHVFSFSKTQKNIRLPLHELPIHGRKKNKPNKNLALLFPDKFTPMYTTAPFLPMWQKKVLIIKQPLFDQYKLNYLRLEAILLSLRTKLFLTNVSTHMINKYYFSYRAYTHAFEWNKIIEYPTYPWIQCTKFNVLKYLIYYYVESLPKIWFKKNKNFLQSLWKTGILKLSMRSRKNPNLKWLLSIYIFETTFSSTKTEFQNSLIFRQFSKMAAYKHHYGENEMIKQFMISLVTDEFIRYNLSECTELWEISNSLKGKPSRYFKYGDKWFDPEMGGVGYFYPGKFIRLCRAQLANYLYHDFLKFVANDNANVFSPYTRFPFLGSLECYNPVYLKYKTEKYGLVTNHSDFNMIPTSLWDNVNKIDIKEVTMVPPKNMYLTEFNWKNKVLEIKKPDPTDIKHIATTLTVLKRYQNRKIKVFKTKKK